MATGRMHHRFPTAYQARLIREASAQGIRARPERAALLRALEAGACAQLGDGLPEPVLRSLLMTLRSGAPGARGRGRSDRPPGP